MLALVAAELVVPVLWSTVMIVVQVISAVYFCGLAWACRTERGATWPTQALPLLFGAATIETGLLLSLNLAPRFGATPAYATTIFVACLAPLWTGRALLSLLVPFHGLYLWTVFAGPFDGVFRTVMTVGGTAALPPGAAIAILAFRNERQAFEDMAAIRRLLDERRDMVAMVAHDLQSPLAGMRALLRTITGRPETVAKKLTEIERACRDVYGAVSRLIEAHRHDEAERPDLAVVQVDALFRDAKAKAATIAAEKGITIVAEDPDLSVSAEPSVLSAIIDNLVSNAIKFSPIGSVVRLAAEPRDGGSSLRRGQRARYRGRRRAAVISEILPIAHAADRRRTNNGPRALYRARLSGADGRPRQFCAKSGRRQRFLCRRAAPALSASCRHSYTFFSSMPYQM